MKRLFVVAKQPAAGQTKTRLCPPLDGETAAALYECLLRDTLDLMRQVVGVQCGIAYLPEDAAGYFRNLAPDMLLVPQQGANLSERLANLLNDALLGGATQVVVMDSDSPTLPAAYVQQAFSELDSAADVVLGPCNDGGYYLIGLKQPHLRLLLEVTMSTPNVVRDTLALADELGLRSVLLSQWYDVDTAQELARLREELAQAGPDIAPATRRFLREWGGG
jgi:uncharacterized protein